MPFPKLPNAPLAGVGGAWRLAAGASSRAGWQVKAAGLNGVQAAGTVRVEENRDEYEHQ